MPCIWPTKCVHSYFALSLYIALALNLPKNFTLLYSFHFVVVVVSLSNIFFSIENRDLVWMICKELDSNWAEWQKKASFSKEMQTKKEFKVRMRRHKQILWNIFWAKPCHVATWHVWMKIHRNEEEIELNYIIWIQGKTTNISNTCKVHWHRRMTPSELVFIKF